MSNHDDNVKRYKKTLDQIQLVWSKKSGIKGKIKKICDKKGLKMAQWIKNTIESTPEFLNLKEEQQDSNNP